MAGHAHATQPRTTYPINYQALFVFKANQLTIKMCQLFLHLRIKQDKHRLYCPEISAYMKLAPLLHIN
jgi:hypothetical protein